MRSTIGCLVLLASCAENYAATVIDVSRHNVVGNGLLDETDAMQQIMDKVKPYSTILIPSSLVVVSGPLTITQSHITFLIDGVLQAIDATPSVLSTMWPTQPPLITYGNSRDAGPLYLQYQSLIYAANITDLRITGNGVIDGRGQLWWDAFLLKSELLMAGRPNLIQIVNSSKIEIDSLELRDSPFWTLHPVLSRDIHIHDISIRAPLYAPNVDGIDPDSCRDVVIENNDISCGDDHIAIKAGVCGVSSPNNCTDPVWSSGLYQTNNVTVRHNLFRTGMGVAIGSEMSGSVTNVLIYNNTIGLCEAGHDSPTRSCGWGPALHLKSTITRGGAMENIMFKDNIVYNSSMFIYLEMDYQAKDDNILPDYQPTVIRNISFIGNDSYGSARGALFTCSEYDACHGIVVVNNSIATESSDVSSPWDCQYIADFTVEGNSPPGLSDCMEESMINRTQWLEQK